MRKQDFGIYEKERIKYNTKKTKRVVSLYLNFQRNCKGGIMNFSKLCWKTKKFSSVGLRDLKLEAIHEEI